MFVACSALVPYVDPVQGLSVGPFRAIEFTPTFQMKKQDIDGSKKGISQVERSLDTLTLKDAKPTEEIKLNQFSQKFTIANDRAIKPTDNMAIDPSKPNFSNSSGPKGSIGSPKQPDNLATIQSKPNFSKESIGSPKQPDPKIVKNECNGNQQKMLNTTPKTLQEPTNKINQSIAQTQPNSLSVNQRLILNASENVQQKNSAPRLPVAKPESPNLNTAEIPIAKKATIAEPSCTIIPKKAPSSTKDAKPASIGNWKNPFPIENNVLDVIVNYVDSTNLWLMDVTKESACEKLLREINKSITNKTPPIELSELKTNCLVAAPLEEIYYRAVVLEVVANFKDVFVRLIDYGNEFYVKADLLKHPVPIMNNLNAFAFRAKLGVPRPLEIMDKLRVQIMTKLVNGIYLVKEVHKAALEINATVDAYVEAETFETFTKDNIKMIPIPEAPSSKITCLDSSTIDEGFITACALDIEQLLKNDEYSKKIQEYCQKLTQEAHKPQVGELCLAIFEDDNNWYRAECLRELPDNSYLLRFIDYGNFKTCNKKAIRRFAKEFLYPCLAHTCVISTGE